MRAFVDPTKANRTTIVNQPTVSAAEQRTLTHSAPRNVSTTSCQSLEEILYTSYPFIPPLSTP